MRVRFVVLAVVVCLVMYSMVVNGHRNRERIHHRSGFTKRLKDSAPTFFMIIQFFSETVLSFASFLDHLLTTMLCVVNNTVSCCTEVLHQTFCILFSIMKAIETLGHGIKCLLEINFNLVSYLINIISNLTEKFKNIVNNFKLFIADTVNLVHRTITSLLTSSYTMVKAIFESPLWLVKDGFMSKMLGLVELLKATNLNEIMNIMMTVSKFFLESMVATIHILHGGCMVILTYIDNGIDNIYGALLSYMVKSFMLVFELLYHLFVNGINLIIMVSTCVIQTVKVVADFIQQPFLLLVEFVYKILAFGDSLWQSIIITCSLLGEFIHQLLKTLFWSTINGVHICITSIVNTVYSNAGYILALCIISLLVYMIYMLRQHVVMLGRSLQQYAYNRGQGGQGNRLQQAEPVQAEQVEQVEQVPQSSTSKTTHNSSTEPKDTRKLLNELEKERDRRMCVICQENAKDILLLPCRHVCLCGQCLTDVRNGHNRLLHCPLCRQPVTSTMKVFV